MIRKRLDGMAGVRSLHFDLMDRTVTVDHELESDQPIRTALRQIGLPPKAAGQGEAQDTHGVSAKTKWQLAIGGTAALAAEILVLAGLGETSWPVGMLSFGAVLVTGIPVLRKGFASIRTLSLNINFLMSLAVVGALFIGEWAEAAIVIVLFALAEVIEGASLDRARNAVRNLMQIAPNSATVKRGLMWTDVPADEVAEGETVLVRPGERFPFDGDVAAGKSAVDQAPITGESVPVEKAEGDPVYAGTVNGNGALEFTVTGAAGHTTLDRIVATVQEAQTKRAPTQRFVDKFAAYYTPVVVALAFLFAVVPPLFFEGEWMRWIYEALVLLVIACPCALVISTPVTVVTGLTAAARAGILIKGGVYLEQGREIKTVAFDKTGTLTEGKPKLVEVIPLAGQAKDEVLRLAASLESMSEHPIAQAVVKAFEGKTLPVEQFEAVTGGGARGTIAGRRYVVGNARLAAESLAISPEAEGALTRLQQKGQTAVVLAGQESVLAVLGVADVVRQDSARAVEELRRLGVETVMLTGDNARTAEAIASSTGVKDYRAEMLPDQKLEVVEELAGRSGKVAMVGDGINDAPALARADIGFAMGAAGTDAAIETADVALMQDSLLKVPQFIRLSRRTMNILAQNIALAIGIKIVFFTLALTGHATLWMAILADMGGSLLVVFNGLRLLRKAP
jgi:Cd2+/Zn2+-exporting ATPase